VCSIEGVLWDPLNAFGGGQTGPLGYHGCFIVWEWWVRVDGDADGSGAIGGGEVMRVAREGDAGLLWPSWRATYTTSIPAAMSSNA
jgi:hypothetical protein